MDAQTSAPRAARGPLADLRVIEMGQLIAGPFCGQLLADFGAEVIKIEPPGAGDPMRQWGREKPKGNSYWWSVVGRNKKSVTLDLRTPEGQSIARELIAKADVVTENFRPGTLERWGLGYEELHKLNPQLVLVRVSGYGQSGPYAKRAGYGAIGEAMGGLRYVVGDPSTPPSRMGISIGDSLAGTFAALGAMVALHAREKLGRGQIVDSAIYEAVLAIMESLVPEYQQAGIVRERTGAILPNVAPSNVYPTRDDSWLLIAANQDTVFRRLAVAMGVPELGTDERYATHTARGQHQTELDNRIADWSRQYDCDALEKLMEEHSIPAGRIFRAPEMMKDPHFIARQAIIKLAHPQFTEIAMQNAFPRLSETPGEVRTIGPELSQHTDEVLSGLLGKSAEELARLRAANII